MCLIVCKISENHRIYSQMLVRNEASIFKLLLLTSSLFQRLFENSTLTRIKSGLVGDHYEIGSLRSESRTVNVTTKLKCVLARVSLQDGRKTDFMKKLSKNPEKKVEKLQT